MQFTERNRSGGYFERSDLPAGPSKPSRSVRLIAWLRYIATSRKLLVDRRSARKFGQAAQSYACGHLEGLVDFIGCGECRVVEGMHAPPGLDPLRDVRARR